MSCFSNHLLHSFPQHDCLVPELLPESDHLVAAAREDDNFLSSNQPNGFRNSHLYWYTLQQYKASKAPHFTPNNATSSDFKLGSGVSKNSSDQKLISVDGLAKPDSTMQVEQPLGHDMNKGSTNFSHFLLRPTMTHGIEATTGDRVVIGNPVESTILIKSGTGGLNSVTGHKDRELPMAAKTMKEPISDSQAKAVVQEDAKSNNGASHVRIHGKFLGFAASAVVKKKPGTKGDAASSSVCSHESSNHPNYTKKRKYHETHETAYDSDDAEEEPQGMKRTVPSRGGIGGKRNPNAEMQNLFERKRRHKISKKMRALQELVPNCDKMDNASLLAKTIEYLKTLELQVQIMSLRNRLFMPPMMLPAPHLIHCCFPMGIGMGMGAVTCSPPQFPSTPSISGATALPGITGNHFWMPPPMSVLGAPFVTCPGGHPARPQHQNTRGLNCS